MKNKIVLLIYGFLLMLLACAPSYTDASINWQTNYPAALAQAKASSKPLLLFFTGSDWCTWCIKLEDEALNTPEFSDGVGNKFIFVKLDFPLNNTQDPQIKNQNKQLQEKYNVRGYPSIILIDPKQEQQIGSTGYRQGGGRLYAEHLQQLLKGYSAYKQQINNLHETKLSEKELKLLYEQAKKLQLDSDANKIVKQGINSNESHYFLIERYNTLAATGQIRCKEAINLRQQLLAADSKNKNQIFYQVALIDFEGYSKEVSKEQYSPEIAIAPLKAYIEKYGNEDKENLWRLQMIILQVYLDRDQLQDALKYAQDCYESAPYVVQSEIAKAIYNIRLQQRTSLTISANAPSHRIMMD